MAKFYGNVGFYQEPIEEELGIWTDGFIDKPYYGDIIKNSRKWDTSSQTVNNGLNINNSISIIADDFACDNLHAIRYVEWMGKKWVVSNVEVTLPRLTLSLGGIFNG